MTDYSQGWACPEHGEPPYHVHELAKIQTAPDDDTVIVIGADNSGQVVLRFEAIAPDEDDVDIQDGALVVAPRHVTELTPDQADLLAELLEHAAQHARSER
jgi:hypothetical protein